MSVKAHNAVLDRTVRGLYFHHFHQVLGTRVSCRVRPLISLPVEFNSILNLMNLGSIGGDSLVYRYNRASDSHLDSLWVILFYKRYLVLVETRSKKGRKKSA
ncbi:hypothetical protein ZMTM_02220 [Methyloradius palustris]|uniref:Uncharacterized protein n=1 Tax=Methyloradius palustris TaxID=2778876 RepID=A0A8D5G0M9_9PROT|nr:hypothetical protein ZMTM_02220 [Methyloradius palustris]